MTLEEGIIHTEDVVRMNHEAAKHLTDEHPTQAEKCEACAEEHQQLAEWLKELKAYRDARAEINQALYDDARGKQNDYERGRKSGIFLCESIISVKLGESRSENPNTCGDAISRQAVLDAMYELCSTGETLKENPWRDNPHIDAITDAIDDLPSVTPQPCEDAISRREALNAITMAEVRWQAVDNVNKLPSVTPQQRTGQWVKEGQGGRYKWMCSNCGTHHRALYDYCPSCGTKMEAKP